MSRSPQVNIGSIGGGNAQGRALARAASEGVSQASETAPAGQRIHIDTLRIEASQAADPRQLTEAVRAELTRRLAFRRGAT